MGEITDEIRSLLDEVARNENFTNFELRYSSGSEKGDGFLSEIAKVQICGNRKMENGEVATDQLDLVCKMAFPEKSQREQLNSDQFFERETYFYNEIAPLFMEFQRERGLTEDEMFTAFPKCYKAVNDPEKNLSVIILEDLRPQGFSMWQKGRVAKIENTRSIVRELAKLHAISFAMRDQYPHKFSKFESLVDLWPTFLDPGAIYNISMKNFHRVIKMLDKPEHKKIYETFVKDIKNYYIACSDDKIPKKFRVINHGDAWMNNILFKTDKVDVAEKVMLLDWQLLRYASPALDLHYHIFTSTDRDLRNKHYDNLLRMYYDQLSTNIQRLGCDPDELFTFDDFAEGLKACGNFAYLPTPNILLLSIAKADDIGDIKEFSHDTEEEFFPELSETVQKEFKKRLTDVLDDLDRLDYFKELSF